MNVIDNAKAAMILQHFKVIENLPDLCVPIFLVLLRHLNLEV